MIYFEKFCRQLIKQRRESSEGRTSDFINLMLKSEIKENEKSSATRSRFEFRPISLDSVQGLKRKITMYQGNE